MHRYIPAKWLSQISGHKDYNPHQRGRVSAGRDVETSIRDAPVGTNEIKDTSVNVTDERRPSGFHDVDTPHNNRSRLTSVLGPPLRGAGALHFDLI